MCSYSGDRDETLIAYLYDEIAPDERAAFDRHLAACEACRGELTAFGGVRDALARWSPPEPSVAFGGSSPVMARRDPWWRAVPVWAQVAAAVLILGVSASVANLDVRYDQNGLSIRTGWMRPAPATQSVAAVTALATAPATEPVVTHAELIALEQRLRGELRALPAARTAAPVVNVAADDVMRRLKTMVEESERRQRTELALRVAEVVNSFNAQRERDLRRIDVSLDGVTNRIGGEVLKQRRSLNYLMSVSQKP